ncbi:MAG: flavin reductase family protein [Actinomycetota bacterium]|nr:flavin reductase family protein [Actinomycetota bacterium]
MQKESHPEADTTPRDSAGDPSEYRAVLGHFASGITLITGLWEMQPVGLTCQSFFSVSLDPPLIAISPGRSSTSWPLISSGGSFCVNVLTDDQEALARSFAQSGSDKFAGVGWAAGSGGVPRIEGALAWLDCRIRDIYEAGDHWLVTAEVIQLAHGTGQPLLFYRGGFASVNS